MGKGFSSLEFLLEAVFVESFELFYALSDAVRLFGLCLLFLGQLFLFLLGSSWVGEIVKILGGVLILFTVHFNFPPYDFFKVLIVTIFLRFSLFLHR